MLRASKKSAAAYHVAEEPVSVILRAGSGRGDLEGGSEVQRKKLSADVLMPKQGRETHPLFLASLLVRGHCPQCGERLSVNESADFSRFPWLHRSAEDSSEATADHSPYTFFL